MFGLFFQNENEDLNLIMKNFLSNSYLSLLAFILIFSCSPEQESESINSVMYSVTVTAGEGGSVSPETGNYGNGTVITITSYPDEGYKFDRWKGTWKDDRIDQCGKGGVPREILSSSSRNCHITMVIDSNKNIQAFFSKLE